MQYDKRLINRVLGVALLASLSLMMLGAGASMNNANAATKLTPAQQAQQSVVLRVYFRSVAERDSIAAEFGAEEVATTGGFLTLFVEPSVYDKLVARGLRVEIDEEQTKQLNSIHVDNDGNTFYGGYDTVEEVQAFMDQMVATYPTLVEKVDIGDSWCKSHAPCANPAPGFNGYDL